MKCMTATNLTGRSVCFTYVVFSGKSEKIGNFLSKVRNLKNLILQETLARETEVALIGSFTTMPLFQIAQILRL